MYSFKKSVCKTGNPFGNHYCRRAYHLKVYMQYNGKFGWHISKKLQIPDTQQIHLVLFVNKGLENFNGGI